MIKLKLKGKLLALTLTVSLLPLFIAILVAISNSSSTVDLMIKDHLTAIRKTKAVAVMHNFKVMEDQFKVLMHNQTVLELLSVLADDFKVNKRIKTSVWNAEDKAHGAYLAELQAAYGWYDIFLINKNGVIVMSSAKESDLGLSLKGSTLKDSSFGEAFSRVQGSAEGVVTVSDFAPYAPSNGDPAAFFTSPAFYKGKKIGYLAFQMPLSTLSTLMNERAGMGETGETYLVGSDYLMRTDSFLDPVNRTVKASFANPEKGSIKAPAVRNALKGKEGVDVLPDYRQVSTYITYGPVNFHQLRWAIIAKVDEAEAMEPVNALMYTLLVVMLVIAVIVGFVVLLFTRGMLKPILSLTGTVTKIEAENNFTIRADVIGTDEISEISTAVNQLLETLQPTMQAISGSATTLSTTSTELSATAVQIQKTAEDVNQGIVGSATAITESSSNINQLAASTQEMAGNSKAIMTLAEAAKIGAESGQIAMKETNDAMVRIADSSDKIVKIVNVITEIANQTNLLSLNAAIEAAKAGEFGKGFAVVAEEVRLLADRSNTSVGQIGELIETSTKNVQEGTEVIQRTTDSLGEINIQVVEIGVAIQEMNIAISEQDHTAQEVNAAIDEINNVSESNASAMNELAVAISQVNETIEELSKMASSLQSQADQFKV